MRYLGSKTSLIEEITNLVREYSGQGIFCDPFGGIATVGSAMKKRGYQVISGDILYFAYCFQVALIESNGKEKFSNVLQKNSLDEKRQIEKHLNSLPGKNGWLVEEYAMKRHFFSIENAMKIQMCMDSIQEWKANDLLNEHEYEILIASLINSLDKVANTAGTYYAYLKTYYRKAKNNFCFQLLPSNDENLNCCSYLLDANELIKKEKYEILYLDPPYNERNYRRYYHLPENIAQGILPKPSRTSTSGVYAINDEVSSYNKKIKATKAFEELIENAEAGCIIFHYTDSGLIDMGDARDILKNKGALEEFYYDSKGYSTISCVEKCQHHIIRVIV